MSEANAEDWAWLRVSAHWVPGPVGKYLTGERRSRTGVYYPDERAAANDAATAWAS